MMQKMQSLLLGFQPSLAWGASFTTGFHHWILRLTFPFHLHSMLALTWSVRWRPPPPNTRYIYELYLNIPTDSPQLVQMSNNKASFCSDKANLQSTPFLCHWACGCWGSTKKTCFSSEQHAVTYSIHLSDSLEKKALNLFVQLKAHQLLPNVFIVCFFLHINAQWQMVYGNIRSGGHILLNIETLLKVWFNGILTSIEIVILFFKGSWFHLLAA